MHVIIPRYVIPRYVIPRYVILSASFCAKDLLIVADSPSVRRSFAQKDALRMTYLGMTYLGMTYLGMTYLGRVLNQNL
jgi:hypothetical protein